MITNSLDEVTRQLGEAYRDWKKWEEAKNRFKEEFYELANASLIELGLMERVVRYPGSLEKARERALAHNPGWKLLEGERQNTFGEWVFVMVEDPTYKPFAYETEGVKYAREIRRGTVLIDDEWMQEEDPDLYKLVTFELPWGERIMRPLERMGELLPALQRYIYNDKLKVTLAPPREVKD